MARSSDQSTPLSTGQTTTVAPAASFEVRAAGSLRSARLVLLDARDSLVSGNGEVEVGDDTRFTFAPSPPLRPGAGYVLRVEGLSTRLIASPGGDVYLPASFSLRVSASAVAPAGSRR